MGGRFVCLFVCVSRMIESKIYLPILVMVFLGLAPDAALSGERAAPSLRGAVLEAPPDVHTKPALFPEHRPTLKASFANRLPRTVNSAEHPSGLRGSVIAAINISPALRATRHDADATYQQVRRAQAAFLPTITATGSAFSSHNLKGAEYTRPGRRAGLSVGVSMPLFTSGRNTFSLLSAEASSLAADNSYLATEQQVIYETIVAYLNVHLGRETERSIGRNVAAMERIVTGLRKRHRAGLAGGPDLALGQSELLLLLNEQAKARENRETAEISYKTLTGIAPPHQTVLPNANVFVPATQEEAIRMARASSPRGQAAAHEANAAKLTANAVQAGYMPQVNLVGRYGRDFYDRAGIADTESWQIGAELSVPLINADSAPAVKQSRHLANAAYYRALDIQRNIEKEIRTGWSTLKAERARVAILNRQVSALNVAVRGTTKEFKAGFRAISDVLQRRIDLARAEVQRTSAQVATAAAGAKIALTIGKIDPRKMF